MKNNMKKDMRWRRKGFEMKGDTKRPSRRIKL